VNQFYMELAVEMFHKYGFFLLYRQFVMSSVFLELEILIHSGNSAIKKLEIVLPILGFLTQTEDISVYHLQSLLLMKLLIPISTQQLFSKVKNLERWLIDLRSLGVTTFLNISSLFHTQERLLDA
jgi:hypothetical protein